MNPVLDGRKTAVEETDPRLPPPGQLVFVHCLCFDCLGYRDETGKWRCQCDGKELPEVLDWARV